MTKYEIQSGSLHIKGEWPKAIVKQEVIQEDSGGLVEIITIERSLEEPESRSVSVASF